MESLGKAALSISRPLIPLGQSPKWQPNKQYIESVSCPTRLEIAYQPQEQCEHEDSCQKHEYDSHMPNDHKLSDSRAGSLQRMVRRCG